MKVLKFGGTSLGNADRIRNAAIIASQNQDCIVVCSAMAGMTNSLLRVCDEYADGNTAEALRQMGFIREAFVNHAQELLGSDSIEREFMELFQFVPDELTQDYSESLKGRIVALGEQLTSLLFFQYLALQGQTAVLLQAPQFLVLDASGEPVVSDITSRLEMNPDYSGSGIYITQGFICTDARGNLSTLSRGGSDFTATLLGSAINAKVIEIWTDIDGMHNNDPRHVSGTHPIRELSYTEAAELAYFGARILHPSCIRPAREKGIPVAILNSMAPSAPGTIIMTETPAKGIRAIAAKDGISILRITSGRMFNAFGFMAKVFEVFKKHHTPVDVVTTSEVSVSVTIEEHMPVAALLKDLGSLGQVHLETGRCIICVVGDMLHPGHIARVMQLIRDLDIRMVSLGASSNNITFVLPLEQKVRALNALHAIFDIVSEKQLQSCTEIT
ncbi:MAG: aspartate kinase [Bacteroidota bacterium]